METIKSLISSKEKLVLKKELPCVIDILFEGAKGGVVNIILDWILPKGSVIILQEVDEKDGLYFNCITSGECTNKESEVTFSILDSEEIFNYIHQNKK